MSLNPKSESNIKNEWPWKDAVDSKIYAVDKIWPKISIVTPCYNQGHYIEETILSILNQNYPNLEYVIIDGGSTDDTIQIIKKYESKLTYWISEPDKGQADAINKGVLKCTGQIFNWINSDDYLAKEALYNIAANFDLANFELLAGHVINFDNQTMKSTLFVNDNLELENFLSVNKVPINHYHQPGVWFNLDKYKSNGELNISLRYCFDHEFTLKYLSKFTKIFYLSSNLVYFRYHPSSKSISEQKNFDSEFAKAYKNFYNDLAFKHKSKTQAKKKYIAYQWHLDLKEVYESNSTNFQKTLFILKNLALSPCYKSTRLTFGQLNIMLKSYFSTK